MIGTDASTGKHLSGIAHLQQSVTDLLTTRLGSRVMNRDYGSRLYELVDTPINQATLVLMYSAVVEALSIWETRLSVSQVKAESAEPGKLSLMITGKYLPDGQVITLAGIEVQ